MQLRIRPLRELRGRLRSDDLQAGATLHQAVRRNILGRNDFRLQTAGERLHFLLGADDHLERLLMESAPRLQGNKRLADPPAALAGRDALVSADEDHLRR